ncbi:MAG TPA: twin-arginine translocase subunit TatC [Gemmatimonadaceae bacterium]|nr:twin-arginine translocase subunit TatC [Gemmatimonadaceae bacterium]
MALVPFPSQTPEQIPDDDVDPDRGDPLEPDDQDSAGKMSFLEHLDELRKRIIRAVIALFVGFIIACFFIQRLFDFIMKPLQALLPPGGSLIFTDPTEAFVLYIKIAAIAGLLIASPAVMTQVWMFIAPGLYSHEKKMAIPFVVMSSFFFVAGAAFSHYIVFPMTWKFFVSFTTDYLTFMPRIEPAFSLYMKMLLAFGLVFQMPTVVLFLARMGMVTAGFLWRNIKYAILIIFIIAAVVTPSADVITQTAMAGPMFLLYLLSIALAWAFGKKQITEAD